MNETIPFPSAPERMALLGEASLRKWQFAGGKKDMSFAVPGWDQLIFMVSWSVTERTAAIFTFSKEPPAHEHRSVLLEYCNLANTDWEMGRWAIANWGMGISFKLIYYVPETLTDKLAKHLFDTTLITIDAFYKPLPELLAGSIDVKKAFSIAGNHGEKLWSKR